MTRHVMLNYVDELYTETGGNFINVIIRRLLTNPEEYHTTWPKLELRAVIVNNPHCLSGIEI